MEPQDFNRSFSRIRRHPGDARPSSALSERATVAGGMGWHLDVAGLDVIPVLIDRLRVVARPVAGDLGLVHARIVKETARNVEQRAVS